MADFLRHWVSMALPPTTSNYQQDKDRIAPIASDSGNSGLIIHDQDKLFVDAAMIGSTPSPDHRAPDFSLNFVRLHIKKSCGVKTAPRLKLLANG